VEESARLSKPEREAVERAAALIRDADRTVALVGAGLSVESGIPPFRGPNGLWTRYGEPSMNGYMEFLRDPAGWWRELLEPSGPRAELLTALRSAEPNAGHHALVRMERAGELHCTITQNIDNLHARAGSRQLVEIHGNATLLRCVQCRSRYPRDGFPVDVRALPPGCPECAGLLKSDTVMFGEPIPGDVSLACERALESCDCMLLVGTSASVYPAAGLAWSVLERGGSLVEVNPEETEASDHCRVSIRARSSEVLPLLARRLEC